jgi:uncharacterized RDD family membrane protein YckC
MEDGQIDFSQYSRRELEEAMSSIDERRFPRNYANLLQAFEHATTADEASGSPSTLPPLEPHELYFPMASGKVRFANYIIDRLAIFLFALALGAGIGAFGGVDVVQTMSSLSKLQEMGLGYILGFVYYASFECLTGSTLGKTITRTVVVNEAGERPTTQQFLIRSLTRFVPFEAFSFLGDLPRGWHDQLSRTYVTPKT